MAESSTGVNRSAPSYELKIGDKTFTQAEGQGLQSFTLEDHMDMVDMLTVRVGGSEQHPQWNFKIGDAVEAKLGSGSVLMFKGNITALEPSFSGEGVTAMVIRALDPVSKLGRGRRTRFWENVKDSDIVSEVGADCGLSVSCDTTDETQTYVLQRNETNVAFLRRLAARNNFTLRVEEDKLQFKKNEYAGEDIELALGKNLQSVKISFNSSELASKVVVRGWDMMSKSEIVGTASLSDVTQIGGGSSGGDTAQTAFGSQTVYITDIPCSSQSAADSAARAEMERISRQFAKGSASVQGNDKIRAGARVKLSGLGTPQDGTYFILSSRHIVNTRSGYVTEFTFCSNTFGSQ
jgi:uncharacterized protein